MLPPRIRRPGARRGTAPAAAVLAAGALLAVPAPGVAEDGECSGAARAASAAPPAESAGAARCLVNRVRAAHGLRPFRASGRLQAAAAAYGADMVRRRYFEHVSPEGRSVADRVRSTGYLTHARAWALGETLGWGTGSLSTPDAIVQAWMNSPPHRAVILSRRFDEAGIGVAIGDPVDGAGDGATFVLEAGTTD